MGEIWQKYNQMGITNKRIYEEYIERQYGYGIGTFNWSLDVPTKKLLDAIGDNKTLITDGSFQIIGFEKEEKGNQDKR